ncbi:MAG TPA: ATP-binding cassette domain-containing protein [Thermoanaerobaculia bacterium]|nr:ATP-binding cassette domain-containing protein [Thermoanaerobaculia bacterium]
MLHLAHVTKHFGTTRAVDDVSLTIRAGEIVAIAGENGAGKTTLMRIAAGELAADAGTLQREGRAELVHQHFLLVNELTIAENIAFARHAGFRFTTRRMLEREAEETIAASGIDLRGVSRRVGELSVGERSKLELIKAISRKPSTLILDEPTSVLTPTETEDLFRVMRRLASENTAVVFISHKLPEVLAIAERIIVMRGGRVVLESAANVSAETLANAMVASAGQPGNRETGQPRNGEILAILGVTGNGQRELATNLLDEQPTAAHIPEDRTRDGIVAQMTIAENLALKANRWRPCEAAQHAQRTIARYSIRASGPQQLAGSLSGGNQQKVILARELERRPDTIVASEPTRGLDIEATRFVHEQLRSAANAGAKILLITSDLDEAFALADAVQVIYRGKLSERMTPEEARTRVASLMAGVA